MWLLLIPPVALMIALLWVSVRSRTRRPAPVDTIEGYRRGMAALARVETQRPRGARGQRG
jgi:hypothetical protein